MTNSQGVVKIVVAIDISISILLGACFRNYEIT